MNKFLLALVLFFNLSLTAQIEFEKGYYVDNNGKRIDGLIKNSDWNYTPAVIEFKSNESSPVKSIGVIDIMELEVGSFHFERFDIQMDMSSGDMGNMSEKRGPEFKDQTVFLKYLVEGNSALLSYRKNNFERFYYKTLTEKPQPLIYKKYKVNAKVGTNSRYQQQLFNNFGCGNNQSKINLIDYNEKDFVDFFADYNKCMNQDYQVRLESKPSGKLNIYAKVGVGSVSLDVDNNLVNSGTSLDGIEYRFGAAFEYNFNYNRNKWSALLEPMFRSFSDEVTVDREFDADLQVQYNSINVFTGVRYYMFLNKSSKLFANLGVNLDVPFGSEVTFANSGRNMDPKLESFETGAGLGLGLGYAINDKLKIEFRYLTNSVQGEKFVDGNYHIDWNSTYNNLSLIIGYKL